MFGEPIGVGCRLAAMIWQISFNEACLNFPYVGPIKKDCENLKLTSCLLSIFIKENNGGATSTIAHTQGGRKPLVQTIK